MNFFGAKNYFAGQSDDGFARASERRERSGWELEENELAVATRCSVGRQVEHSESALNHAMADMSHAA